MGHESRGRAAASLVWLLVVSFGATTLLFAGSQDGSLVGGRIPSAIIWPVLWIGTLAVPRPPLVHDLVSLGIAIGGIPFVLIAPSASVPVFVAVIVALWGVVSLAHFSFVRSGAGEKGAPAK